MNPETSGIDRSDDDLIPEYRQCLDFMRRVGPDPSGDLTSPLEQERVRRGVEAAIQDLYRKQNRRARVAAAVVTAAIALVAAERSNKAAVAQDALEAARAETARLRFGLDRLRHLIERSGLADAIRVPDPPFVTAGRDAVAVRGSADPRFIARVTARVGAQEKVLYRRPDPADRGDHEPFETRFAVPLGAGRVDATLEVEPFPEAARQFPEYFGPERTRRAQVFLATSYGLIADPTEEDLRGVADLEAIELRADAENPSRYVVAGVLRQVGDPHRTYAWLIIDAIGSGQMYVGSFIAVDPDDPEFRARCFLGTRLDQDEFQVFVVTSSDPNALHEGQQIPKPFDWEAHGFRRSRGRFKVNDGENGFAESS